MKNKSIAWLLLAGLLLLVACGGNQVEPTAVLSAFKPDVPIIEPEPVGSTIESEPVAKPESVDAGEAYPAPEGLTEEELVVPGAIPLKQDQIELGDAVIIYSRSGGFAGLMEEWHIYADGRVESNNGSIQQVAPEQVARLLATAESSNFNGLQAAYLPRDSCCDRFSYSITIHLDDVIKTVSTMDGVAKQPEALTVLLTAVNDLLLAAYP